MPCLIRLRLAAAPVAGATVRLVVHDGRAPQRPPASHFEDHRFVAPLAR